LVSCPPPLQSRGDLGDRGERGMDLADGARDTRVRVWVVRVTRLAVRLWRADWRVRRSELREPVEVLWLATGNRGGVW